MRMYVFILFVAVVALAGCATHYSRIHNGIPEYESRCSPGGYDCSVLTNDQVYPTARAKYGQMPGDLQDGFAVQEAVAVHHRKMEATLNPYGVGMMGGYGWEASQTYSPNTHPSRRTNFLVRDQYGNYQLIPTGYYAPPANGYYLTPGH